MRRLFTSLLLFLMLAASALAQAPRTRVVKIQVLGMVCDFCAQGLMKTFKKQDGVVEVRAYLEDGAISVRMDEAKVLSDETLKQLVEDAGFKVKTIKLEPPTA